MYSAMNMIPSSFSPVKYTTKEVFDTKPFYTQSIWSVGTSEKELKLMKYASRDE